MGRVNTPTLTSEENKELEQGFRNGKSHCFRERCNIILLKSQGNASKDVASILGVCEMSINNWLSYCKIERERGGIAGLYTKLGRGRKPIISEKEDKESILALIKSNRQRMRTAKAEWETKSGKKVSASTFKNFLKSLAENINDKA